MEIWKNIDGYKPIYQVSDAGRVRSIARETIARYAIQRKTRILKATKDHVGYNVAYLYDEFGKRRTVRVHRLVALAFIPNPDGLPEIDHIDGNKQNNFVVNLKWTTHKGNCSNPVTAKKQSFYVAENAKHKRSIIAYTIDGKFVGEWPTITMAAQETGTNRHSISYVANGKYKSANNLIWKYNG